MTASLAQPLTEVGNFDPTRDSRHKQAKSARDQADWLAWLELGGAAPRTCSDYEWVTARLLRYYPQRSFDEFIDSDIAHVLRTFPAPSRRERSYAIRSWFKWGVRTRRIDRNPCDTLPIIKRAQRKHIQIFTDMEIAALTALPDTNGELFQLLFDAGLRRGEAIALQRRDVYAGEIIVRRGKGGKYRAVPMFTRLEERLTDWFARDELKPADYLWPIRPGGYYIQRRTPMGNTSFAAWYRKCMDEAQVVYRNPHVTRHTFATRWLRRGGRLETLSQVMGHSSIKITFDQYAHLDTSDVLRDLHVIQGGAK